MLEFFASLKEKISGQRIFEGGASKKFIESEQEKGGVGNTPEVSSEEFYFRVERFCIGICISVNEEV